MYGYSNYEINLLTPQEVINRIPQEKIFELVLKEPVIKDKKYKSPFRVDSNGDCRIIKYNGKLYFEDFADSSGKNSKITRDCFKMVQDYYNVTTKEAIKIICKTLLDKDYSDFVPIEIPIETLRKSNIIIKPRNWGKNDRAFWSKFLITEDNLKEDGVIPLKAYSLVNRKGEKFDYDLRDIAYCFKFNDSCKIYRPTYQPLRFLTNCNCDDVGNLHKIDLKADWLIITKSYKDHRVLRNTLNSNNIIWFQNEGMFPCQEILDDLQYRFSKILILFDNDKQGEEASKSLLKLFNNNKAEIIKLSKWKDSAEFISKEGRKDLLQELNTHFNFK